MTRRRQRGETCHRLGDPQPFPFSTPPFAALSNKNSTWAYRWIDQGTKLLRASAGILESSKRVLREFSGSSRVDALDLTPPVCMKILCLTRLNLVRCDPGSQPFEAPCHCLWQTHSLQRFCNDCEHTGCFDGIGTRPPWIGTRGWFLTPNNGNNAYFCVFWTLLAHFGPNIRVFFVLFLLKNWPFFSRFNKIGTGNRFLFYRNTFFGVLTPQAKKTSFNIQKCILNNYTSLKVGSYSNETICTGSYSIETLFFGKNLAGSILSKHPVLLSLRPRTPSLNRNPERMSWGFEPNFQESNSKVNPRK